VGKTIKLNVKEISSADLTQKLIEKIVSSYLEYPSSQVFFGFQQGETFYLAEEAKIQEVSPIQAQVTFPIQVLPSPSALELGSKSGAIEEKHFSSSAFMKGVPPSALPIKEHSEELPADLVEHLATQAEELEETSGSDYQSESDEDVQSVLAASSQNKPAFSKIRTLKFFLTRGLMAEEVQRLSDLMPKELGQELWDNFQAVDQDAKKLLVDFAHEDDVALKIADGVDLAEFIHLFDVAGLQSEILTLIRSPAVIAKIEDKHQLKCVVEALRKAKFNKKADALMGLNKPEGEAKRAPMTSPEVYEGSLPDMWRAEAPSVFSLGAGQTLEIELPGELAVVKKLKELIDPFTGEASDHVLVREILGNQCYRILGANFPESYLIGEPGELVIKKDEVLGERIRCGGSEIGSSDFSRKGVSSRDLALLTVSAALLQDYDFCGMTGEGKVGHNFRVGEGGRVFGFDSGEAFNLSGKNTALDFLKDAQSDFPLLNFVDYLNRIIFDRGNTFLQSGETVPPCLLAVRRTYEKQKVTAVTGEGFSKILELYAKGEVEGKVEEGVVKIQPDPLWVFLKELLKEASTPENSELKKFVTAFNPYFSKASKDYPTLAEELRFSFALNNFIKSARRATFEFRPLKAMTSHVTPECWEAAMSEVLARADLVKRYIHEVDLPEDLLNKEDKGTYEGEIEKNKTAINDLRNDLAQKLGHPSRPREVASFSEVFSERIYYPSRSEELERDIPALAVLNDGATGAVSRTIPSTKPFLEFEKISLQVYDKSKGCGRRSFKSSYSDEIQELKNFMESPGMNRTASWKDVEEKVISIFAEDIRRGSNPYDWTKLSNRTLWLFLMEAHYQQEKQIQKSLELNGLPPLTHAVASFDLGTESGQRKAHIWNQIYGDAAQNHHPQNAERVAVGSSAQIAAVARIFPRVRGQYQGGFDGLLKVLSSEISDWKSEHVKWYHLGRRIFGIKGIRRVLAQFNNKTATPDEMLKQIDLILTDRIDLGRHQDTKALYQKMKERLLNVRVPAPRLQAAGVDEMAEAALGA
jgi:hypothetical protein